MLNKFICPFKLSTERVKQSTHSVNKTSTGKLRREICFTKFTARNCGLYRARAEPEFSIPLISGKLRKHAC